MERASLTTTFQYIFLLFLYSGNHAFIVFLYNGNGVSSGTVNIGHSQQIKKKEHKNGHPSSKINHLHDLRNLFDVKVVICQREVLVLLIILIKIIDYVKNSANKSQIGFIY